MALRIASASNQRLITSTPFVTAYPITIGMWLLPDSLATNSTAWLLRNSSNSAIFLRVGANATQWFIAAADGSSTTQTAFGAATVGQWAFIFARWISATNRKMDVIEFSGSISHGTSATSRAITGIDGMAIGGSPDSAALAWNGRIAEFWLTNTDIQGDGLQLQDDYLRRLAFGGPFAIPRIGPDLLEYRTFRKHPTADEIGEVRYGRLGQRLWANTNAADIGAHPPLPSSYESPTASKSILMV